MPPFGKPMTRTDAATVSLVTKQKLSISVLETLVDSDLISGVSAGDTVKYKLGIKNAGTTTLSNVIITSSLLNQRIRR